MRECLSEVGGGRPDAGNGSDGRLEAEGDGDRDEKVGESRLENGPPENEASVVIAAMSTAVAINANRSEKGRM